MGKIGDFFRKKVKDEEKKIGKKYHGEYSREELRSMAANSVLKKIALKGGIAVTCIAAGVVGLNLANNDKDKGLDEGNKIAYESEAPENNVKDDIANLVNDTMNNLENPIDDISTKIDNISTREDALKIIKEIYIKEYNKANGTEYSAENIEFSRGSQHYVYDLDGVYVTHGATPDIVKNKLEKENEEYEIKDDVKVYSSYLVEDGKKTSLESFAFGDKMIVDVILGDEYINGKEISYEDKNTLIDMRDVMVTGMDLTVGIINKEKESSVQLRKNTFKEAVLQYQKQHTNKNMGISEIGG